MSLTLGEKLRQAREERGFSISEVAEQTRISALYLESIENNDYRILPGGIFNKGFVRSYAKVVGVDEQEALQDYAKLMSEQGIPSPEETKTYRSEVLTDDQNRSSSIVTLIFALVILGSLAFGVYYFVNYWRDRQNQPAANNSANTSKTANDSTNANSNVNAAATTLPPVSEIKAEFKALKAPIYVSHTIDGKSANKLVNPNEPLIMTAKETLRFSYYKGFTPDKAQLMLNGKQITLPNPPAKGNFIFTINKENIGRILQSGTIESADPAATAPR